MPRTTTVPPVALKLPTKFALVPSKVSVPVPPLVTLCATVVGARMLPVMSMSPLPPKVRVRAVPSVWRQRSALSVTRPLE